MIAEGRTTGVIVSHGLVASQKGTPGLEIRVKLDGVNRTVPLTLWLSSAAMDTSKKKLQGVGFRGARIRQLDERSGPNFISLAGTPVGVNVKHEIDDNGNAREKFDLAFGGGSAPLPEAEFDNIDTLFAGSFLEPDEGYIAAPVVSSAITDEDLPF